MEKNYAELFCQSIDEIVKARIDEVSYDQTILCVIEDASDALNGRYVVSYNSSRFEAFTSNTTYTAGMNVYVSIPQGDWNEQKLIVSRKTDKNTTPITYVRPFDSFVDITNNLISKTPNIKGLVANNDKENGQNIVIWSYNVPESKADQKEEGTDLAGYTRLGISAEFKAWLRDFNTVQGSYGLKLRIEGIPEDEQSIAKDDADFEEGETPPDREIVYYDFIFDSGDMVGNPYNFESFFLQEKLFDISDIYRIRKMELMFYQKPETFYDIDRNLIPFMDKHQIDLLDPNLFVKDVYIALGYDSNEFDTDAVIIYSLDSTKFIATQDPPQDNHKEIQLRWVHKIDDKFKSITEKDELNYTITWYRKVLGSRSDTVYSGVDWQVLSRQTVQDGEFSYEIIDKDWIAYNETADAGYYRQPEFNKTWLIPDITWAEENIKAIIMYDGQPYYSDILTFTNEKEVVSKPTVDAVQALTVNCEDDSYGNYLIYNLGGRLLDPAESSKVREFRVYFKSMETVEDEEFGYQLTEAESIEWIIPGSQSMIVIEPTFLGGDYVTPQGDRFIAGQPISNDQLKPEEIIKDGYWHIFRYGDKTKKYAIQNQNTQRYKISGFYSQMYSDNTIKCVVVKDKITYTAVKELTFGPAGTSGTDYTFIVDFDNGETAMTITDADAVTATARLYDYEGNEITGLEDKNISFGWLTPQNLMTLTPILNKNNKTEIKLNDSVTSVPNDNYCILKATFHAQKQQDDGGWGDFDLNAYMPIPIRTNIKDANNNNEWKYKYITGSTTIVYNSLGYLDDYSQFPYALHTDQGPIAGAWEVFSGSEELPDPFMPQIQDNFFDDRLGTKAYVLRPINIYAEDACDKICVVGSDDGNVVWSQPIYIFQNKYPSSIINSWNGELKIDTKNNAILAAKIAAGRKEKDNTFTGVMMGDWDGNSGALDTDPIEKRDPDSPINEENKKTEYKESVEKALGRHTGVFGFKQGQAAFGFQDDGSAFIGLPDKGRIEFDGKKSIITSNYMANGKGGMLLDFDDGLIELASPRNREGYISKKDGYITINASAKRTPFRIGSNFSVDWDGTLWAKDGMFEGSVEADYGQFSNLVVTDSLDASSAEVTMGELTLMDGLNTPYVNFGYGAKVTYAKVVRDDIYSEWRVVATGLTAPGASTDTERYVVYSTGKEQPYAAYLGCFDGSRGGLPTTVVGIRGNPGTAIVVEANGAAEVRIGNQSGGSTTGANSVILAGSSCRWHSPGIVGSGESVTHSRFILKSNSIEVTCPAEKQTGIYARFA